MSKKFGVTIRHTFLEKGHTENEGDHVHSVIERRKKKMTAYVPSQWYAIMRTAKSTGTPYNVIEMSDDNFFDYKSFVKSTNWTKNDDGEKVYWSSVRQLLVEKQSPTKIQYKIDLTSENFKIITIFKTPVRQRGRQKSSPYDKQPQKKYHGSIPISKAKWEDLMKLCRINVIPKNHHGFYKSLKFENNIVEDSDDSQ